MDVVRERSKGKARIALEVVFFWCIVCYYFIFFCVKQDYCAFLLAQGSTTRSREQRQLGGKAQFLKLRDELESQKNLQIIKEMTFGKEIDRLIERMKKNRSDETAIEHNRKLMEFANSDVEFASNNVRALEEMRRIKNLSLERIDFDENELCAAQKELKKAVDYQKKITGKSQLDDFIVRVNLRISADTVSGLEVR